MELHKPSGWIRKLLGVLLHVPSLWFALVYFGSSAESYPYLGGKAFLVALPYLFLSCLFGAVGVSIWRWKLPWR